MVNMHTRAEEEKKEIQKKFQAHIELEAAVSKLEEEWKIKASN